MATVYFSERLDMLLGKTDLSKLGKRVAIKVHFGERGCTTFVPAEQVRKVYELVRASGRTPTLVESNVLYKGSRTTSKDHLKVAREHGFGDMDIDICDGEHGQEVIEYDGCKFGRGIDKYDSLIVFSHFKGHVAAGFGAAIKNLSMGLASRAGKLDMHSKVKPSISDDCIGCGICAENCNADAISMDTGKAVIDQEKCEGCAMCIAFCANGSVQIPWRGRTAEGLQTRMAEYAAAIQKRFSGIIYINALINITKDCDCMGKSQKPVMQDVGYLLSTDMLAIDAASLDLAERHSGGSFGRVNSVDNAKQIEAGERLGLGEKEYDLIKID
jgi:uncharacterized protein